MNRKLKQYLKWYFLGIIIITLLLLNTNRFTDIPNELIYSIYISFTAVIGSIFKYDDTNYDKTNINSNNKIEYM